MRAVAALAAGLLLAPASGQGAAAAPAERAWFAEARVGLRVHFGLYAAAGSGADAAAGAAESALDAAGQVDHFTARAFDPVEWVRIAKDAGAGYLLFPAKSRDGFCLWRSAHTDFDVLESPHERDMLVGIARACRDEGVRLGLAYAVADLHHHADLGRSTAFARAQLTELIDVHSPALVLLYGAEASWTDVHAREVVGALRARAPGVVLLDEEGPWPALAGADGCLVRSADGTGAARAPRPIERCDLEAGAADDLAIRTLSRAVSRGGQVLLEVQADGSGSFRARAVGRLRVLGEWLRCNGEAVLGAQPARWASSQGVASARTRDGTTRLYLHVLETPADGELVVADVDMEPLAARVLGGGSVPVVRRGATLVVRLPAAPGRVPVVAIDLQGTRIPR